MSILNELIILNKEANEIIDSELSWEEKYHLIFSSRISSKVFDLINLDYYDPDTSYEEDVLAFINAFNSRVEKFKNG